MKEKKSRKEFTPGLAQGEEEAIRMSSSNRHLEGKVAIVTGANRGIGKETALELSKAGAKVSALKSRAPLLQIPVYMCLLLLDLACWLWGGKEKRERERDAFKLIELGLAHLRQRIFEIYTRKQ